MDSRHVVLAICIGFFLCLMAVSFRGCDAWQNLPAMRKTQP